ncbi:MULTISPECIES: hypothetical protein [unclassified Streptomyces]|uniref:hypothetical protein n=1 Tax=unclassified Streptomyces TaxID=2593676 RepID=UPI00038226CE|nr:MULTISPECIES: hypothetical protein [unclassified Streptomyces]MYT27628.1 hypothetical protein [Streptomyces sp. SID8354]
MTGIRNRATATLAAVLVLPAGVAAAAPAQAAPAVASAPAAAPATTLRITEGQVGEVGPGGTLLYPAVTSCLTITVRLADGGKIGAHASLFQVPGEYRSDRILGAVRQRIGTRAVRAVEVRGAVGAWYPGYFTKAIESYPEDAQIPVPTAPDPDGLARAVADGLGRPHAKVTVQDLPDGDQTVE